LAGSWVEIVIAVVIAVIVAADSLLIRGRFAADSRLARRAASTGRSGAPDGHGRPLIPSGPSRKWNTNVSHLYF